ncbi:MAG TPA: RNA 2',3'-cyclic phosphodiesterase [Candidatus Limnocylindria bacterium]|nr:RNA 2',3'-cyclic phosphodiesterase [Candidatus Limnocylindria bacterium]
MTPDAWRLFVAVPIGDRLRADLEGAVAHWRDRADLAGLRWTDAATWHLTLAFMGATDACAVPGILDGLRSVAVRCEPMRLVTGGLGAFPSAGRARVAWYGIADPERRLATLARDVAIAVGLEDAGRFRAHITLARARAKPADLRAWLARADPPVGGLGVDRVDLMRSHLGRGPARYEVLESLPLGVAAHV